MSIIFGTIQSISDDAVMIHADRGQILTASRSIVSDMTWSNLKSGTRVRIRVREALVESVTILADASTASQAEELRIAARVVGINRQTGKIQIRTDQGEGVFGPVTLSDTQWQTLTPEAVVTILRSPDGTYKLILPDPSKDKGPEPEEERSTANIVQGSGTVRQVTKFYVRVETDDGTHFGYMKAHIPNVAVREEDKVAFRAIRESNQIVWLSVLERHMPGFGGKNPCAGRMDEMEARTERQAMSQLARHLCAEERLEWYWITPRQDKQTVSTDGLLNPHVLKAMQGAEARFTELYTHQAHALSALNAGFNVLVTTPTASGKTYCYNPAVFQSLAANPAAHALYVFPLNALLNDQVSKLQEIALAFKKQGVDIEVGQLIGGMTKDARDAIDAHPPQVLATNPEMLSWILDRQDSHSVGWPEFLRHLRFVVLDEVHAYRSLLGLHMAGLIRRMLLACQRHGNIAGPSFVLSSATVGSPDELATRLTSLSQSSFTFIGEDDDGSAQPQRHWMVLSPYLDIDLNPHNMHLYQAALALVDILTVPTEELNAILFAKSIKDVHFLDKTIRQLLDARGYPALKTRVKKFASALLNNQEKRTIYDGLKSGQLRAVVSTNALEAGIDIGKLDVCVIAGFPFHVMRMRQMAGRAGRKYEGAVIFIPNPLHTVDRYYYNQPERLITQPPESFVIDHENPYIARKHVVAAAATMAGGVLHNELIRFGHNLDDMIEEAQQAKVLSKVNGGMYTARRPGKSSPWGINNMRSAEQDPYSICTAPPDMRDRCVKEECIRRAQSSEDGTERCQFLVQLIDRQYVYREAHPDAVFEDREGNLYHVLGLSDEQKTVWVRQIPDDTNRRTFPDEAITVKIIQEHDRRELAEGVQLAWGNVIVTRHYAGYYEFYQIPRRRCRSCRRDFPAETTRCPTCGRTTRPFLANTRPEYRDFPIPYAETVFTIHLETIACWLALPSQLETELAPVSPCKIRKPNNRVSEFLKAKPVFSSAEDLANEARLPVEEAKPAFEYFQQHRNLVAPHRQPKDKIAIYPPYYGQCLAYHLRQTLEEPVALRVFGKVSGYPVLTDERHVCRNCISNVLIAAAHTLEHVIALRYPTVALGDSQDLGFTTVVVHPQTRKTTVFWYDNYEGGIGAAEKIFGQFDTLLHDALPSLNCECNSEAGCPLCTHTLRCDRGNEALNKAAVRSLLHILLELPRYMPTSPFYWTREEAESNGAEHEDSEWADAPVRPPAQEETEQIDPFDLLRVQPHVHDQVLERVLDVRGEEIDKEVPHVSVAALQRAFETLISRSRSENWEFPASWTPFEMLHIQPNASKRQVHVAFKVIVMNVHPDRNPEDKAWANAITQRVNLAWDAVQKSWKETDHGSN